MVDVVKRKLERVLVRRRRVEGGGSGARLDGTDARGENGQRRGEAHPAPPRHARRLFREFEAVEPVLIDFSYTVRTGLLG